MNKPILKVRKHAVSKRLELSFVTIQDVPDHCILNLSTMGLATEVDYQYKVVTAWGTTKTVRKELVNLANYLAIENFPKEM